MSEFFTKDEVIFNRNQEGNLIPVKADITINNETKKISILPITRGRWLEITELDAKAQDQIIICEHLLNPKISPEDYTDAKFSYVAKFVNEIIKVSLGINDTDNKTNSELCQMEEDALKKKLTEKTEE